MLVSQEWEEDNMDESVKIMQEYAVKGLHPSWRHRNLTGWNRNGGNLMEKILTRDEVVCTEVVPERVTVMRWVEVK